jgi:hypothetical protein
MWKCQVCAGQIPESEESVRCKEDQEQEQQNRESWAEGHRKQKPIPRVRQHVSRQPAGLRYLV